MNLEKESQSNTVEIFWLRRIAQNQPTAWVGRTRNREMVHISHRYGRLEVCMRKPVPGRAGAFSWRKLVSFEPEWLQSELELEENWSKPGKAGGGTLAAAKREARMFFEWKIRKELLASECPESGWSRGGVITLNQLVRWFSVWNEALAKRNGSAETALRIEVTAWTDQPQRCDGSLGRSINFPNVSLNGGGRTYASF
jgi:hypothetical protein